LAKRKMIKAAINSRSMPNISDTAIPAASFGSSFMDSTTSGMTGDFAVVVETRSTGRRLVEEAVMEDVVYTAGASVVVREMVDEVDTSAGGRTDTSTSAGL
jgi:hypothetical protein